MASNFSTVNTTAAAVVGGSASQLWNHEEFDIIIVRLVYGWLAGALIGLEREVNHYFKNTKGSAGVRTHSLVALGATIIMVVSVFAFDSGDPSRMAAQVVSGIGFLGAGVIFKGGTTSLQGITTASTLWISSAIGLAVGAGFFYTAGVSLVLILFTLAGIRRLEEYVFLSSPSRLIRVKLTQDPENLPTLAETLSDFGAIVEVKSLSASKEHIELSLAVVNIRQDIDCVSIVQLVMGSAGVLELEVQNLQETTIPFGKYKATALPLSLNHDTRQASLPTFSTSTVDVSTRKKAARQRLGMHHSFKTTPAE